MNTPILLKYTSRFLPSSIALAVALVTACTALYGQDSTPSPAPSGTPFVITPDQRDKLKAAYEKAVQDPKVTASQKTAKEDWDNYRVIVKKKVLAKDPGLQALFDKADKAALSSATGVAADPLTADDQKAMHDAFQKVETDPEIKEAMAKVDSSRKAKDVLIRAAILEIDPSLKPVLDAIDASRNR